MELGKYELYEELGRGGYGTVYRALDTTLEVERAVKVLHPVLAADMGFIERFKREARIAARLEHPHIVPVYEIDEQGGRYYLVMKYMAGGSLKYRLEKDGPLVYEMAQRMICQVGQALDYAHQKGLVHRDVKPGNILLDTEGGVRLADFGFAKAMQAASSASLSVTGGMAGTPAYMAPELWSGKEAGPGTDLYSLACVFYEMLVGKALFAGETPPEVIKQHIMDKPHYPVQWPQGVPPGIEKVLERALAKEQGERYPAVREFMHDLQGLECGKEQALHQEAARKAVTEKVEQEQGWVKCEVCGRVYDAGSMTSCPYCRLQGTDENEQEGKPVGAEGESFEKTDKTRNSNRLGLVITVGVILALLFMVINMGGESRGLTSKKTSTSISTRELTSTKTVAATKTNTPGKTSTPQATHATEAGNIGQATAVPQLAVGSEMLWEKDGMEMVYVPAGPFVMGSGRGEDDEEPVHTVNLDAFWIDKYEVTNAQYEQCVAEGACEASGISDNNKFNGANQPVASVNWEDAQNYCQWAGRRLPSEAEWEKAARGTEGSRNPWGDDAPSGELLNYADVNCTDSERPDMSEDDGFQYTAPVGSFPAGASPYGALDMAGNVFEWVNDWYAEDYYQQSPSNNPQGPSSGMYRIVRGSSYYTQRLHLRIANRIWYHHSNRVSQTGFRCALSAE